MEPLADRHPGRVPPRRRPVRGERDQREGTDLRPGRYTDLASLVQTESDQYDALEGKVEGPRTPRWPTSTSAVKGTNVKRFQRRVEGKKDPAGLTPRSGPGVTVTLSDAPEDVIDSTSQDLNLLVVHQQDIQAVVNAMWKGGAERGHRPGPADHHRRPASSARATPCSSRASPTRSPTSSRRSATRPRLLAAIANDDYLEIYREQARPAGHLRRLGHGHRGPGHRAGVRRTARHHLRRAARAEPSRAAARLSPGGRAAPLDRGRASPWAASACRSVCPSVSGGSVGSWNVETTIVTVAPSGPPRPRAGSAGSPCPSARWSSSDGTTSGT